MHDPLYDRDPPLELQAKEPSGHESPTSPGNNQQYTPDWAAQAVLAAMVAAPDRQLMALIQEKFPSQDLEFYASVLANAKWLIEQLIASPLHKSTDIDSSPTLLDRLCFAWRFLYKGDILVRKLKQSELPKYSGVSLARAAFHDILPVPLQEPLLKTLLEWLRLGADARYFPHYWSFRRSKPPSKLTAPFDNLAKTRDRDHLRRVIWWCLRAHREQYIEVRPGEPVRVEFEFVVEEVLKDLKGWCGPEIDQIPNLAEDVEIEFNSWLRYCRLELPAEDGAPDASLDPEIAKAFVKYNDLKTKLRIAEVVRQPDERVQQLEATIRQYAEENRALEERVRSLEALNSTTISSSEGVELHSGAFTELRDVLKTIDTKYSFDTLNAVSSGETSHLTLRSFVSHLFYALRKRGLSEYPKEEYFNLTYEASGLYDCDGFEVPPSGSVAVKVIRKGWALNARGRWVPIRRARVAFTEQPNGQ